MRGAKGGPKRGREDVQTAVAHLWVGCEGRKKAQEGHRRARKGPGRGQGGPKRGRQDMQRPLHISGSGRRAPQGARKSRKVRKVREMRKESEESEEGDGRARGQ